MDLSHIKTYGQFVDLLRNFRNWHGDPVPYDSVGVVLLLGALLDNMQRHGIETDFEEMRERLTPGQVTTLQRIAADLQT